MCVIESQFQSCLQSRYQTLRFKIAKIASYGSIYRKTEQLRDC